jgi:hypothetical protein
MTFNGEIFGLRIRDAGPIFAAALVLKVLCGLTSVIAEALAAAARKQTGAVRVPDASICRLGESLPPRRS